MTLRREQIQQFPDYCGYLQLRCLQKRKHGAPGHFRRGQDLHHAAHGPADAAQGNPHFHHCPAKRASVPPGLRQRGRRVHPGLPGKPPLYQRDGDPAGGPHRERTAGRPRHPALGTGGEDPAAPYLFQPADPGYEP